VCRAHPARLCVSASLRALIVFRRKAGPGSSPASFLSVLPVASGAEDFVGGLPSRRVRRSTGILPVSSHGRLARARPLVARARMALGLTGKMPMLRARRFRPTLIVFRGQALGRREKAIFCPDSC
jgi:hypothetical protein